MAALVEQNQQSALLLAEAAKNMAVLAAAITKGEASPATDTAAPAADASAGAIGEQVTGDKPAEEAAAPGKRTKG